MSNTTRTATIEHPIRSLAAAALLVTIVAGCASSPSAGPSSNTAVPAVTSVTAEANSGEGGAEAPAILFVSPSHQYRVEAPGTMSEAADGSATAHSGSEQLAIDVRSGSATLDPAIVATSDTDAERAASAGFQLDSGPGQIALRAGPSIKAVWREMTTSAVTGKPESRVTVRYWVPRSATELAVLTYTVGTSQYDPQGADDIAETFRWP